MSGFAPALSVANAVLYEGYILYPYTASARKNRIRWQFGVLVPHAYTAKGTGEPAEAQTEILLECGDETGVEILVRFLHVEARIVERWSGSSFEPVASLAVGSQSYLTFDEGVEREVTLRVRPAELSGTIAVPIAFPDGETTEPLRDAGDVLRGRVVRRRWSLHGAVAVTCEPVDGCPALRKLRVVIDNRSSVVPGERSSALRTAFVSTHVLLHAQGGQFLSVLDPPEEAAAATKALANRHTWPVLVGEGNGEQRAPLVLSSPIILYDFPAVAPQSEADTFDATEVDELMMLSVLSLSDEEREEARATDPRARAIVERAERFGPEELRRLHGTLLQGKSEPERDPLSVLDVPSMDCVFVHGVKVGKGSTVRLHPKRRADVWDVFLDGKVATVRAIHQDVENEMYVAVTVDDDPASEFHEWYGRSFFFYPDEVEPVAVPAPGARS